ncbi:hypothetical protein PCANC_26581 [Puccinia coronata f. sp. avenae]|uniref:Uncharacterized protein n=1 Tax=Puccinia coronata f. sp. avenae TaxID=200324 RepID=A0A2N5TTG3_9BASI|nr:hypothetical protein PCANC_26581 [Puccinia coronata f. sp. avenae]
MVQQLELLVLVPAAGAVGLGSSSWSCWSWFQQLELLVLVPEAACNLWSQLELSVSLLDPSVSDTETDPNSWSSGAVGLSKWDRWFQLLEPSVSETETDGSSCWSCRSRKL